MQLMGLANFRSVFVGIESPNEASLIETKKVQNVRPKAGTLLERVRCIQQHGIDVWCGMILGFDHDDRSMFDAIPKFIDDARIANALIGLLHAIPTTPLYARLKGSGRLNDAEATDRFGTNVVPLLMSREELRDGFCARCRRRIRSTPISGASMRCSSATASNLRPSNMITGAATAWLGRGEAPGTTSNFSLSPYAFSSASRTQRSGRGTGGSFGASFMREAQSRRSS